MSSMMTSRRLSAYEALMRQIPGSPMEITEDHLCTGCRNHRPDWDYRFCVYTECPNIKGMKTFWEEVYEHDEYTDRMPR